MKRRYLLIVSAILLILIGVLRASGAVILLIKGKQLDTQVPIVASDQQITIVAIGLSIIGILFVLAAINLIRKYSYSSWLLCWIVLFLFLLSGLINGYFLFGQPLDQGQRINIIAVVIVGILLLLGKASLKPRKEKLLDNQKNS